MCTYITEKIDVAGSGKGAEGWFPLTEGTVYFDHPVHATAEHTLNIDLRNPGRGPGARVAVELTADAARALAEAILRTLDAVPADLIAGSESEAAQSQAVRGQAVQGRAVQSQAA